MNTIVQFNGSLYIGGGFAGLVAKLERQHLDHHFRRYRNEVNAGSIWQPIYIGGNFNQYLVTYNGSSIGTAFNTVNGRVWSLLALLTRIFGVVPSISSSPSTNNASPHFSYV